MVDVNRMSALDVTRACGLAGKLSAQYGSGEAAAMSSCFHALVAAEAGKASAREEYLERLRGLTPEQRDEVLGYCVPTPFRAAQAHGSAWGNECNMANAEAEVEVLLHFEGDTTCVGHLDLRWVVKRDDGSLWVIVVDLKRSRWTSSVDSLQLAAYGMASAIELGAEGWTSAIWALDEGEYLWGKPQELLDMSVAELHSLLEHAATNTADVGSTGGHCDGCWSRLHCPEYLMPPSVALAELAPFAEPGMDLAPEEAAYLLMTAQRAAKTADAVLSNLRAWADRNGGIKDGKGKVWSSTMQNGKRSITLKVLEQHMPEALKYASEGKPFPRFSWRNAK